MSVKSDGVLSHVSLVRIAACWKQVPMDGCDRAINRKRMDGMFSTVHTTLRWNEELLFECAIHLSINNQFHGNRVFVSGTKLDVS